MASWPLPLWLREGKGFALGIIRARRLALLHLRTVKAPIAPAKVVKEGLYLPWGTYGKSYGLTTIDTEVAAQSATTWV